MRKDWHLVSNQGDSVHFSPEHFSEQKEKSAGFHFQRDSIADDSVFPTKESVMINDAIITAVTEKNQIYNDTAPSRLIHNRQEFSLAPEVNNVFSMGSSGYGESQPQSSGQNTARSEPDKGNKHAKSTRVEKPKNILESVDWQSVVDYGSQRKSVGG